MTGRGVQTAALWLIAIVLSGGFVLDHIRPAVLLALNRAAYLGASRVCHEARAYAMEAAVVAADVGGQAAEALRRSAGVAIMDCHAHESLRAQLLAARVDERALNTLDLEAQFEAASGLPSLAAAPGA